jgi:VanZ family protein
MTRAKRVLAFLSRWPATVAVAACIVALSRIPAEDVPYEELPFPHFDKLVHLIQYSVLGFLLYRSVRHDCTGHAGRAAIMTGVVGLLFGLLDELHQSTVGRSADIWDLTTDAIGLACGIVAALLARRFFREKPLHDR